jgi:ribosomal protein S18 acetylase RimI-like enzyme
MKIRNLKPEDLAEVKKLCSMVHWPLTTQDIKRLYELEPDGWFCAEIDNQYVGQVMGITIGSLGCVGMIIVHEDYRRMGICTALTTEAVNYLRNKGVKTIRLDATPDGYNIYKKLGFVDEFSVRHYVKGVVVNSSPLPKISGVKPLVAADIEAIIEFDKLLFGVNRAKILKALFNDSRTFVVKHDNEIQGYVMCRGTTTLCWLGPLVANDIPSAERLLQQVLRELSDREIRLGVPGINHNAITLFDKYGFRAEYEITRMRCGLNLAGENTQCIFAEAGHEKT